MRQRAVKWLGSCILAAGMLTGCEKRPPAAEPNRPTTTTAPTTQPSSGADATVKQAAPHAVAPKPVPAKPKRPDAEATPWATLVDVFQVKSDAELSAQATGGNRLVIKTENVRVMTLDLRRLPPGAAQRGPWNLQIDGQGIEIMGLRSKVMKLTRSSAGVWTAAAQ